MRACPQPIVAAIDGVCAGAGAILAMASDLRLGTSTAARSRSCSTGSGLAGCDPVEQERDLGGGETQAQIGGHGQDRAGAGAYAVDGGDDRLRTGAHGLDHLAGEVSETRAGEPSAILTSGSMNIPNTVSARSGICHQR